MNLYNLHNNPEELHKHKDRHSHVPDLLWKKIGKGYQPSKQEITNLARNADMAVKYAQIILNGKRFPEGEPAILKSHQAAYNYAETIIVGPWPEAEDIISTNPTSAYNYASYVIKGRWKKGEKVIANHPLTATLYAKKILKKKWPKGEAAIKKHSTAIKMYNSFLANADYNDRDLLPTHE